MNSRTVPCVALAVLLGALAPVAAQNRPQFAEMKLAGTSGLVDARLADLNGDGHLDIAALRGDFLGGVLFTLGDGTGAFGAQTKLDAHHDSEALRLADLDGDGFPEALATDRTGDELALFAGSAAGLLPAVYVAVGDGPRGLDAGDLDGDGDLDVVVACTDAGVLMTLAGDGQGALLPSATSPTTHDPLDVALADFSENGVLDAATIEGGFGFQLQLLNGNGTGGFLAPQLLTTNFYPGPMQVADVNEDAHADLVLLGGLSFGVQILLGNGHGPLVPTSSYQTPDSQGARAALADLDGDGHLDLAMGRVQPPEVHLRRGDGTGSFPKWATLTVTNASAFDAGDLDEDGHVDLLALGEGETRLSVLLADPAGLFRLPILAPPPSGPARSVAADFDDDGLPDIMVSAGSAPKGLFLYRGLGDGSSQSTPVWSEPDALGVPGPVAAADMNLDGLLDVVEVSAATARVRVLLHAPSGAWVVWDSEPTGTAPTAVAIGALDDDGLPDVAVSLSNQKAVHLFFGQGGGRIGPAVPMALPAGGEDVLITDVTGDSVPDLLVGTGLLANQVMLWMGSGTGSFGSPQVFPAGGDFRAFAVSDLQPDGAPDVLVALGDGFNEGQAGVLHGDGSGSLLPVVLADDSDWLYDIHPFDSDGDGRPDLATAGGYYRTLNLHEQDGAGGFLPRRPFGLPPTADLMVADANGDGADDVLFAGGAGVGALLNGDGPLATLGDGLAGGTGVPALAALSDFTPGAPLSLRLQNAAPSAGATLVLGLSLVAAPFKGGVLVPDVDALVALATDTDGAVTIDTAWPVGLPSGLQLWLQSWVTDASAPKSLAATRGLEVTTP